MRLFSVVFGNSTYAISVVLAVFMTGLALGAMFFGRIADRWRRPLILYGVVEVAIGASALSVPLVLVLAEPAIAAMYASGPPALGRLTAVRTLIAAGILLVPTVLMGATLPIISKAFVKRTKEIGETVALLYGVNTLGAVTGCLLTGFFLIQWFGVTNSSRLAAALNIAAGLLAIASGRYILQTPAATSHRAGQPETDSGNAPASGTPLSKRSRAAIFVALFISGFSALSLEVVWSRVLGFVFQLGMNAYAFTIVLTVFLASISAGGLLYRLWSRRIADAAGFLGIVLVSVGASVLGSVFLFARWNSPTFLEPFQRAWLNDFLKAGLLISVPAVLMGISFPLACRIVADSTRTLGGRLGRAVAANTLGCVLGPLMTGFLLIPLVGTEVTLKLLVTAGIVTGLAVWTFVARSGTFDRGRLGWALAILAATLVVDLRSTELLPKLFNARQQEVVYFKEGPSDSVLAVRRRDGIELIVGGSVGAGSTLRYQRTDELLAYIPLLLHQDPREVAVVGFGTGRTTGLYGEHPSVRHVDVVEIAQGALDSGRDVFAAFNRGALSNPKVTTILDDGFNFMKYGRNRYDVISLDPFTPRDPGSARLYTREFLLSVRDRLKEGGIVVLWAYPSTVRTASFRVALKTFQAVFAHTTVWTSPVDNMFLFVATPLPLKLDAADLAARLASRPHAEDYRYHVESADEFRSLLWLDEPEVRRIVALEDRPLFTVDRPNLEFLYLNDPSPALSARRVLR
jgi:spermidine synthase